MSSRAIAIRGKRAPGLGRPPRTRQQGQRGVALLLTLLLLALMSILGLVMVLAVNSDMMINGYYGNYRSAFYAADSGMNIARAALLNNLRAQVNMTPCIGWGAGAASGCTADPLASTSASSALTSLLSSYGSLTSLNTGEAANSWKGNFQIADVSGCTNAVALAPGYPMVTHVNAQGQTDAYKYVFNYTLCSVGRSQALQRVVTSESGSLTLDIQAKTATTQNAQVSFAAFGTFINNFPPCLGPLVPGTLTGPMFANGAWQFGTMGPYIFTDPVSQTNAKADYWFGSTCIQSPTTSYTRSGQTIKPTFQGGLNFSQPTAPLPPDSFSQKWAVLDSKGCGEGSNICGDLTSPAPPAVSNADLNASVKNINGTPYPMSGATSGVYLPYDCVSGTCTVDGGGMYVEGNAGVVMSIGTDGATPTPNPTQTYAITQGTTTTTITVNNAANTTTVRSGTTTLNLVGVPKNLTGATPQPATMLYVNGTISGLKGTGQGVPAIQDNYQTTITATGTVNVTGDVIYKTEPVTLDTSNTLKPGWENMNQVLGIFTPNGKINISSTYTNQNLQLDASIAAISTGCVSTSCGLTASGHINTFNLVGGRIAYNIFSADVTTRNTYFDRRFTARPGFAPPWFPATTMPMVDVVSALPPDVIPTPPQRLSWVTWPQ